MKFGANPCVVWNTQRRCQRHNRRSIRTVHELSRMYLSLTSISTRFVVTTEIKWKFEQRNCCFSLGRRPLRILIRSQTDSNGKSTCNVKIDTTGRNNRWETKIHHVTKKNFFFCGDSLCVFRMVSMTSRQQVAFCSRRIVATYSYGSSWSLWSSHVIDSWLLIIVVAWIYDIEASSAILC